MVLQLVSTCLEALLSTESEQTIDAVCIFGAYVLFKAGSPQAPKPPTAADGAPFNSVVPALSWTRKQMTRAAARLQAAQDSVEAQIIEAEIIGVLAWFWQEYGMPAMPPPGTAGGVDLGAT